MQVLVHEWYYTGTGTVWHCTGTDTVMVLTFVLYGCSLVLLQHINTGTTFGISGTGTVLFTTASR